ncbi:putative PHD type zinc finger protein with BAH domain-containing protein [Coemansia sp. BCRC 34301]|nr:putative PHD type zinc finger protein with BAH domain-containing protein [Coemansia sp. BCRC 34301]
MSKHLALPNSDSALPPPTSVVIAGGTVVAVDDYVYLQPENSDDPYYIGRIMEFVYVSRVRQPRLSHSMATHQKSVADSRSRGRQVASSPASSVNGGDSHSDALLRVRLAWFQRPRDLPIARVRAKDARLLVATMHSDINPVNSIKGKCQVRHSSEIADFSAWKAKSDHYYYSQLFDRYSTRLYDIIPVTQIRNAPQNVLQKLLDTYEFIFAEGQKITDLVSTRRACTICATWCSINDSLKCSLCEKNYHMQCLDPPIARKPAKGYSWQCAACRRGLQEQKLQQKQPKSHQGEHTAIATIDAVDTDATASDANDRKRSTRQAGVAADDYSISLRSGASTIALSSAAVATVTGSGGSASAAASDNESRSGSKRLKLSHGDSRLYSNGATGPIPRPKNRGLWPFRYFGINTDIDDVLHDDERIYPRAVSRIGPKFQAVLPDMVGPSGPELDKQLVAKSTTLGFPAFGKGSSGKQLHGPRGKDGANARWVAKSAEQLDRTWEEIEVRRGNHDDQLFFKQPAYLLDEDLDMYMVSMLPFMRRHFEGVPDFTLLDCQDAALHGLVMHEYDVEEALISIPEYPEAYIRSRAPGDNWSRDDLEKFNDRLREYGSNLQAIHESIPNITRRAITLRYYLERHTELGTHLLEAYESRSHLGHRRSNFAQGEGAGTIHIETSSDAGLSSFNTPASSPRIPGTATRENTKKNGDLPDRVTSMRCVHCQQDRSTRWYDAPTELTSYNTRSAKASAARRVICGDCRDYWFHYAAMPDLDIISARKQRPLLASNGGGMNLRQQVGGLNDGSADLDCAIGDVRLSDQLSSSRGNSNGSTPVGIAPLQHTLEKPKRSAQLAKLPMVVAPPRQRVSKIWPMLPCDVCKRSTKSGDHVVLTCSDCGLCVHHACSGYPERARINLKRWRCSVCENVFNPTISISYSCILCRKEAPPEVEGQPRPLMWRTSGNNWAHAICALAIPETRLAYDHGHVIVNGMHTIPRKSWMRPCAVCAKLAGTIVECCDKKCYEGVHPSCAHVGNSTRPAFGSGPQAMLVALPATASDASASKEKAVSLIASCPKHPLAENGPHVAFGALGNDGQLVAASVVASKLVPVVLPGPKSLLQISLEKSYGPVLPKVHDPLLPSTTTLSAASGSAKAPVGSGIPNHGPAAMLRRPEGGTMWSRPSDNPVCGWCSATFSPIWWPAPPGVVSNSHAHGNRRTAGPNVLCHRCHISGSSSGHNNGSLSR